MKQVIIENGSLHVSDLPRPTCSDGEVLVKNHYSIISSGTELSTMTKRRSNPLSFLRKHPEYIPQIKKLIQKEGILSAYSILSNRYREPIALGYSCAGEVIDIGSDISDISVGDIVACAGETANHAEYVSVPRNLIVRVPRKVTPRDAAFTTLGAIALQGIRRANVSIGDKVAVIGLGLIGILTYRLVQIAGAHPVGFDIDSSRIDFMKKHGHTDSYQLSNTLDSKTVVDIHTGGVGFDAVIICASTPGNEPLELGIGIARKKGRIVVVGDVQLQFSRQTFYEKELDLLISTSYGPGRYDASYERHGEDYPLAYVRWTENRNMQAFILLLRKAQLDVSSLITSTYSIDQAKDAYTQLESNNEYAIAFEYDIEKSDISEEVIYNLSKPSTTGKGTYNIGIIGVGHYAGSYLIPHIMKNPLMKIRAVASKRPHHAGMWKNNTGASYSTTNYLHILKDKDIDAVVIATRHNLHIPIAIDAVKQNKPFLIEKPLGITNESLDLFKKVYQTNPVRFMVGYNRRYSSHTNRIKKSFEESLGPWYIQILVNAGPLDSKHWLLNPKEGGGRIIGDGIHFIDYSRYIVGRKCINYSYRKIDDRTNNSTILNSMSTIMQYEDESVANISYVTFGNNYYPKEQIHFFKGGNIGIIKNFDFSIFYSSTGKGKQYKKKDKGIQGEIQHFYDMLADESYQSQSISELLETNKIVININSTLK